MDPEKAGDLGILDMFGKPVGAEQEPVTDLRNACDDIAMWLLADTYGLRDDILARPVFGLVFGDRPGIEKRAHLGVIAALLNEVPVTKQVASAVTRPDTGVVRPMDKQRYHCRAYGSAIQRFGMFENCLVRAHQPCTKPRMQILGRAGHADGVEFLHDSLAGKISSGMSPHPIGHHPKTGFRPRQKAVFIHSPAASHVGGLSGFEGEILAADHSPVPSFPVPSEGTPPNNQPSASGPGSPCCPSHAAARPGVAGAHQ